MVNGVPVCCRTADDALVWFYCCAKGEHKYEVNISY